MDFEKFKFHIQDLLTDDLRYPRSVSYLAEVRELTTSSDILLFLKKHGFIGYQNYELLAYMVRCLWKENQKIVAQMENYIKKYKEFEQELSLSQLEEISHEEDLCPVVPSGLPEFSLRTNGDTNAHQWRDYLGKFPWSIYILLKSLIPGSVIMTYVALPCVVSDILRDLTDPGILTKLESMGVTVVLLPLQSSQPSESSFLKSEHVKDDIKRRVQMPNDTEEPLLDPLSNRESSLDLLSNKELSLSSEDKIDKYLLTAIENNSVSEVIRLLEKRASPNCFGEYGYRAALHIAIDNGNNDIAKVLLSMGADPSMTTKDGKESPLHIAVEKGDNNIVQTLLSYGANPNVTFSWDINEKPLHYAAERGHSDIVQTLLDKGANIEAVTKFNKTPLHYAAESGHSNVVQTLLANGANIEAVVKDIETPLFIAAVCGRQEIVEILLFNGARTDYVNTDKQTLLHYAAEGGCNELVTKLIAQGVDITAMDIRGRTALYYAARGGNVDIVKTLLAKGCDPNIKDGNTTLHAAVDPYGLGIELSSDIV